LETQQASAGFDGLRESMVGKPKPRTNTMTYFLTEFFRWAVYIDLGVLALGTACLLRF